MTTEHTNHIEIAPMRLLISRLFRESPEVMGGLPGQAPAIECVVMFASGQAVRGALSTTPEGVLRMLSPGTTDKGTPVLVEQFFDYSAVSAIALTREMTSDSRVISLR